ncbi:MAG: ATP-binding protein [Bacteroidota bacterium]
MNTEELVEVLAKHRTIGMAPREELHWIAEHGTLRHLEQGEIVTTPTQVVDGLFILLTGRLAIYMNRGTGLRKVMEWVGGDVTGILPYSRLTTAPGETIVEEPTDAVAFDRKDLPQFIRNCYEVTAILVHVMLDRARRFTSTDLRDEKMFSLGKLAAGFAHELNNPASAALRDAKSLSASLATVEEAASTLLESGLTSKHLAAIDGLWEVCKGTPAQAPLTGLALADREDSFAAWLKTHGLDENLAVELARTAADTKDLDAMAAALNGRTLDAAIRWVVSSCGARTLVANIERATTRIHTLVAATKGFTHLGRAEDLESVEISHGLKDAMALLEGKARGKSVEISLDIPEDYPPVRGHTVEVNQIWMNLIDNAIDAVATHGHVGVAATLDGGDAIVSVVDDGPGIPAGIQERIFDPFFTTKPVGEGTGLGLDIVRRIVHWHNGDIKLDSRPGRTEFRVRLPIAGPG